MGAPAIEASNTESGEGNEIPRWRLARDYVLCVLIDIVKRK